MNTKTQLKILYRKNLKISPSKLAIHTIKASLGLSGISSKTNIVVLGLSDGKYYQTLEKIINEGINVSCVADLEKNKTEICFAYIEKLY
jgi:hypothetical protein